MPRRSARRRVLPSLAPTAAGPATIARSSSGTGRTKSPSPIGASTAGPNTTTGARTTKSRNLSPRSSAMPRFETGLVLEGGSIDVNGAGLLLTTEECLLCRVVQARNPGLGRARTGTLLRGIISASHEAIWLERRHRRRRHARPRRRSGALHVDLTPWSSPSRQTNPTRTTSR